MFDNILKEQLANAKNVAIIGAKDKIGQPVDNVGKYLLSRGFTLFPVHPVRKNVWGLETFKDIASLAAHLKENNVELDIICFFRASEYIYDHALEVIENNLNPKLFWLQEGIKSKEAAEYIKPYNIKYIEDLCIKTEYARLLPTEFDCVRCGICCEGKNGIVVDDSIDLPRMLDYFNISLEELDNKYTLIHNNKRVIRTNDENYCLFFEDGKGCTIHVARPDICRAWAYFRGNILDNVSFEMAKSDCKGIIAKAPHSSFQKEGIDYLKKHKLIRENTEISAANALKYSEDEINFLNSIKI